MKVSLICSAGISASHILEAVNLGIVENNHDLIFSVITPEHIGDEHYDVILLAPQVEYLLLKVKQMAPNSIVVVIPSSYYINNDGSGIIEFVTNMF